MHFELEKLQELISDINGELTSLNGCIFDGFEGLNVSDIIKKADIAAEIVNRLYMHSICETIVSK